MTPTATLPLEREAVCHAITALYEETDIALPTSTYPITPLGPVLERLPLRCEEMLGLTSRKVQFELLRRRAIHTADTFADVNDDLLAGFLFACGSFAWIFIASGKDQPVARKRFSAAHELGHFVLHFRPELTQAQLPDSQERIPKWRDEFRTNEAESIENSCGAKGNFLGSDYERCEREANLFAAELLMPEAIVRSLWGYWQGRLQSKDLTTRVAETLLVSREAITIRLNTLKLG